MWKVHGLVLVAALLAPLTARAEVAAVTLRDAIRLALARNHLVVAAGSEYSASKAGAAASHSRYFPRVTLEETGMLTTSPTKAFMARLNEGRFSLAGNLNHPPATGDFQTTLLLTQPVFDPAIGVGIAIAGKETERADFALQRRLEDIALKTAVVYLNLHKARAQAVVAAQAVRDVREHQRLAAARSAAGLGLKSDELLARTALAEQEQQAIRADNAVTRAMLQLSAVTGSDEGDMLDAVGAYPVPAITADRKTLETLALENRPELKEMAAGVEKAALGVKSAQSAYYPTLHGMASYQMNDRDVPFGRNNDAWLVGATLRWEIFDGNNRGSLKEKARAEKSAADEYLASLRQDVRFQVADNWLLKEEADKRLEVARHAREAAAEGVRLLARRYENSVALMVEVLDAQTVLNRSRASVAETEAEAARASLQLLHASGMLLKEILK